MIRLIILDLDGTVIGSDAQVAECVWTGLEPVVKAGIKVAVSTGRPNAGVALKVAARLGPRNAHVFQSGALVADSSGNTLHVAALREAVVRTLINHARETGHSLEIYTPTSVYVERKTPIIEAHAKMIGITPLVTDLQVVAGSEPVVRAQWVVPAAQRATVESLPIQGIQVSSATSPALPDAAFVSLTREGVDKGSGVRHLAQALGVPLEDVMAVGDSEGDIPMLDIVGHPRMMPNGPLELRNRYPTLAHHVDDCGVVEAFEQALSARSSGSR